MSQQQGITFIEVVIVLAVAGVLFAIAPLVLPRDGLALRQATEGLIADTQLARFESISRATYVRLAIDPDGDAYSLLEVAWNAGTGSWDVVRVLKQVRMGGDRTQRVRIASAETENDLLFDPRGNPIGLGVQNVVFDTPSGRSATVTISQQGRATR